MENEQRPQYQPPRKMPAGAVVSKIPEFMLNAARGLGRVFSGRAIEHAPPPPTRRPVAPPEALTPEPGTGTGWMGPGTPMRPLELPQSDTAGRRWDYQPGINSVGRVRQWEGITHESLRNIAENFDLLRLAIQTRKDQIKKLGWSIQPKVKPGERRRPATDTAIVERCAVIQECLKRPDGVMTWDQWVSALAEDAFVLDGVAWYRRRYPDGRPYALELIDPATIQPLVDVTGRSPLAPDPAFAQIIKGSMIHHYTRNELTYWVRNPRTHKLYGLSEVEQVVRTATLGIARLTKQIGHYSDGNIPDVLLSTPADWSARQVSEFQQLFDQLMSDPRQKRKARFVPGGAGQPVFLNNEQTLFGPFDEWLARIICYAFSLPPFPFVKETNRATAETQYDAALAEGLGPFLTSLKAALDIEIAEFFGQKDLEMVWDGSENLSAAEKMSREQQDMKSGVLSIDDVRAERGLDPVGLPPLVFGIGPMGFLTLDQLKQIIEAGSNLPASPMPMDAAAGGDPLAGAPPDLLAQLGISSPGAEGPPGRAGPAGGMWGQGAFPGPAQSSGGLGAAISRMQPVPGVRELLQRVGAQ